MDGQNMESDRCWFDNVIWDISFIWHENLATGYTQHNDGLPEFEPSTF